MWDTANPREIKTLAALLALAGAITFASPPARAQARGELLYSTHCIGCHAMEIHWRDKRTAIDWTSLTVQVRRWQAAANLGWSEADIQEVAGYLNDSIYKFPRPTDSLSRPTALRRSPTPAQPH